MKLHATRLARPLLLAAALLVALAATTPVPAAAIAEPDPFAIPPSHMRAASQQHSVAAAGADDVICSFADPSDCYPRDFVAGLEYAPIREGQVLPPGLDIRMDFQSGEKWAKLPSGDAAAAPPAAEAEVAVVPVDADDAPSSAPSGSPAPAAAPAAPEATGPVVIPRNKAKPSRQTGGVSSAHASVVTLLVQKLVASERLDAGEWDVLEDASHHGDTGLRILEQLGVALEATASHLMFQSAAEAVMFYRVIGNIHQNNEKALKYTAAHHPGLLSHLVDCADKPARPYDPAAASPGTARVAKSCLYALGALVRGHPELRTQFLQDHHGAAALARWTGVPALEQKSMNLIEDLAAESSASHEAL
ncbi:hypothetical protein H9P43_001423 [Blastocladiella emersonii ATCC 22665]|nr:hypothetical protein H9P43_001423 [Blastocladiella emersonii ATCC 22665]